MNTAIKAAYFALGVVAGFTAGSLVARKVYGKKVMEHIKKTDISGIKVVSNAPAKTENEQDISKTDNLVGAAENVSEHIDSFRTMYNSIVSENGYSSKGYDELTTKYQIDPDDFGNDPSYSIDYLLYYQDTNELVDIDTGDRLDPAMIIGERNVKVLSLGDPSEPLYFRNSKLMKDYSIEIGDLDE